MRKSDAELGRLIRRALRGKRLKPRRLDCPSLSYAMTGGRQGKYYTGYLESDADFLENNSEAAVAILEALAPSVRKTEVNCV